MVTLIKYGALSGGEKYNVNQMWIDGLSTDSKPTTTVEGLYIPNGSVYTEVDTGKTFMFDKENTTWYEVSIGGGGGGGTQGGIVLVGETTTALTDEATTNPITVDGQSYTAQPNDAVIYGSKEFLFDGTKWHEFGDLSGLASKDIGAMTGYTKASTGSAIATTDTLNQAIGKVEKRVDVNENNILSIQGDISDLGDFILSPNLFDKDSCIAGKYLTAGSGRTYNDMSDNADFTTSNIIPVIPNKKYCINSYISTGSTAVINLYDTSGNYLQQLSPSYRSNFINVYVIPYNAYYVRFSFFSATTDVFNKDRVMFVQGDEMPLDYCPYGSNIITNSNVANILNRIVNPCDYQGDDAQVFNKCLCIGDSITEGTFNYKDGSTTKYVNIDKYSYPTFLTKISGIETTNMGVGGYTSVEWWNANQSTDFSGHDICIINLGINDVLESVSTADTKTALANIITAVKAANKNIKVFLASVVPAYSDGTTNYNTINTAIREVASSNAAYFIDLARYSHVHKGTAYENGHLTAYGYWRLAKDYLAAIGFIMHRQPSSFKYIQFIGTNYTP